jgi:uncharacterized protein YegL
MRGAVSEGRLPSSERNSMVNSDYTHMALIADRSGSMYTIQGDMNGAIRSLLEKQAKEPGTLRVDITTFDTKIEFPYTDADPSTVTEDVIQARGSTALLDAIGVTISRLGRKFALMKEEDRPGTVIVVIVTDGMENASQEYSREQIKALVEEQTEKWHWTFMYLAANVDAFATGAGMGFARGQTIAYAASSVGTQNVYDGLHANTSRARRGDESGFTEDEREAATQK